MKTSELTGAALDWAVAKCEGQQISQANLSFQSKTLGGIQKPHGGSYSPSTDWTQGGVLIEREYIKVGVIDDSAPVIWAAQLSDPFGRLKSVHSRIGSTPLIAAMRCYVASRLGDEVDVPEELK